VRVCANYHHNPQDMKSEISYGAVPKTQMGLECSLSMKLNPLHGLRLAFLETARSLTQHVLV
jgi:hypothetical protein